MGMLRWASCGASRLLIRSTFRRFVVALPCRRWSAGRLPAAPTPAYDRDPQYGER